MKNILKASLASLALALPAGAAEFCDFSLNPEARDGHTPADTNRFFTVCASKRYEAHPSSVMLPDGKTIIAFWDFWQGGPCGPAAISKDAGRTWTRLDDRIPKEFGDCHDEPKTYRFVDPKTGKGRIRVFASYGTADEFDWRGADDRPLAEAMPSVMSEDDGETWKFMPPLGADFACVVGFSGMVRLQDGAYLGVYSRGNNPNGYGEGGEYRIMGSYSRDGGVTFEKPFEIAFKKGSRLFLPTLFRSPDGKEICCLAHDWNKGCTWALFSRDEGKTWSEPARMRGELSGFEHSVAVLPDGRILATFHRGKDIWGWLAPYDTLHARKADGFDVRFAHNYGGWGEAGTPNVHVRPDGEIVLVAYSQMDLHRPMPFVFAMTFRTEEIEQMVKDRTKARYDFEAWNPFAGTKFRPLTTAKLYGPFAQELKTADKKEHTIQPYDGTKKYLHAVAGSKFTEIRNKTGCFEVADHAGRNSGNAAILVWTVDVPGDCKARFRLIGAPSARCYCEGQYMLPAVLADIFEPRTSEIKLKKGRNEISAMVYQPQHRGAGDYANKPMRIAAGLELEKFTCVSDKNLNFSVEEEVTIDSEMEADE